MDNSAIISITSLIIVALFSLFSTFLLTVKTSKKLSNQLLAAFLIVTAIDISVFFYHNFIEFPHAIEMLRMQISSFKDPLLFLYILSVLYSDFKLRPKHLVLLLPWVITILILIPNFFLVSEKAQIQFRINYTESFEGQFIIGMNRFVEVLYIIAEIYYLLRYRKLLLENYTSKDAFYNYHWVKQLIIFILVGQLLTFIKGYIRDSGDFDVEFVNIFRIILLAFGLFFSFWLVFKALLSPKLFRGIAVDLRLSKEMISEKPNEFTNQIESIRSYMLKEEPFLDASLTVKSLSEKIDIPHRELSIIINQELGQHFFDFINKYRIEKAMSILKDPAKKKHTVLEILYEVGFNSKSSFNTAFKKHTGKTPTAFRKNQ
ncbi:helix-turn-helix domain-containing protein [Algibacter amylolyticus]|uniref:AraC family transcriptional regulator n=1 Tax=Algibacter amylolyticus TaxID=1608400 RepID=A0A5M7B9W9_9FLAO|nr:AraC family transcriptional regulator [Algibacter amylolyticus]KAA5825118.1 AraC family transcriptional regulator [Algibacter amylolyticus]MBB5268774.1 AraC-like DNA-binding protein [Algibacter amylolyticus]TSJ77612.1 helix-turn-helix domain-containing protein [Algibacter amylolyticus]